MSTDTASLPAHPAKPAAQPPKPAAVPWRWLTAPIAVLVLGLGAALTWSVVAPAGHRAELPSGLPEVKDGKIIVPAEFRERIGLKVGTARRGRIVPRISVVGKVAFDPSYVGAVGIRTRGMVSRLLKVEGDRVSAGDVLAEIESGELAVAQADVVAAGANKHAAELNAKREKDLAQRNLTTATEVEDAERRLKSEQAMLMAASQRASALGGATGGKFGVLMLRAPITGTLVERKISAGQSVEGNTVAFRVADLSHLWVELAVVDSDVGDVHIGDPVELASLAEPDDKVMEKVDYVGELIDPKTRTAAVRVGLHDPKRQFRPGMAVTAHISGQGASRDAVQVPDSALTTVDGNPCVFVAESDGVYRLAYIELGRGDGTHREVTKGLSGTEKVVIDGAFALKSELFR